MATDATTPAGEDGSRPRARRLQPLLQCPWAVWGAFVATSVLLVAGYLLPSPQWSKSLLLGCSAVLSAAAMTWGTWAHRPHAQRAWWLLTAGTVLMLVGATVRPWVTDRTDLGQYLADPLTLGGYLCCAGGLVRLARAHSGLRREVVCDVLVLTVTGALLSLNHFVLPAVDIPGRPLAVSVLAGTYPLVDVVFLALLVDLLLTAARRASHQLLVGAIVLMLVGDVCYAVLGARGELSGSPLLDLPFVLAAALIGAAALHPSQRVQVVPAAGGGAHPWSPLRLTVLALSLVLLLVAVVTSGRTALHHWAALLATAAALALLLVRAVSAVNAHARVQAVLLRRASHDPLTDLPNRTEVLRTIDECRVQRHPAGHQVWVLYLDLDGFKRVNDGWGHQAGDQLIRAVAQRLQDEARGRAVVGRLAGDEFALVLTGTQQQACDLAEGVLDLVVTPVRLSTTEVVVSASVGIAPALYGASDALQSADAAMYRAKAAGRNQWVLFEESMRRDVSQDVELELDLRHAVADGALSVAFQPIVDIPTGRPAGVEALLRWDRPLLGPVSPVRFVPLLEETGLVTVVGMQVLRESVAQLARWRAEGVVDETFFMSVNVSPRQLLDAGFPDAVAQVLAEAGVEGRALLLEITESSMVQEDELTLKVLYGLRALGCGLAVDDFGTGYSALSYLRRFPVTRVKVDRSFVDGMCEDPSDAALVRAVEAMSRALGLSVTAEGVETAEQRDALHELGVRYGQGWLWGRPEPAERCAVLLRTAREGADALREGADAVG
ncbi:putative bifunctional diguanylate cyclase/phosphodiesterase [Kineococcus glutinatus]|uniref:Diguanylate cyclase (GGDEF)-like protein n=1 Tax=Kineococcus glutinatus TaxID=1070872 RepID=A0ABP9HBI6_9ACTN